MGREVLPICISQWTGKHGLEGGYTPVCLDRKAPTVCTSKWTVRHGPNVEAWWGGAAHLHLTARRCPSARPEGAAHLHLTATRCPSDCKALLICAAHLTCTSLQRAAHLHLTIRCLLHLTIRSCVLHHIASSHRCIRATYPNVLHPTMTLRDDQVLRGGGERTSGCGGASCLF